MPRFRRTAPMAQFRRRPVPPARLGPPVLYAVPIDQSEAHLLVIALRTHDRMQRELYWTPGSGPSHSAGMADRILKTAGTAACYGQQAIPLEVADLDSLRYTLAYLQEQQPTQPTHALAQLLNMLHARSGMARLRQWRVTWSDEAGTMWWEGTPPQPAPADGISG